GPADRANGGRSIRASTGSDRSVTCEPESRYYARLGGPSRGFGTAGRLRRAGCIAGAAVGLAVAFASTTVGAQTRGPAPEPNFAGDVTTPRPCALDTRDPYERKFYASEGWRGPNYERYPGACERLKFAYGPLVIKPGQN